MSTERVYCITCKRVTDCKCERKMDIWIWTCLTCGKVADEDYVTHDEDYQLDD